VELVIAPSPGFILFLPQPKHLALQIGFASVLLREEAEAAFGHHTDGQTK
jgi:hypothetical protein